MELNYIFIISLAVISHISAKVAGGHNILAFSRHGKTYIKSNLVATGIVNFITFSLAAAFSTLICLYDRENTYLPIVFAGIGILIFSKLSYGLLSLDPRLVPAAPSTMTWKNIFTYQVKLALKKPTSILLGLFGAPICILNTENLWLSSINFATIFLLIFNGSLYFTRNYLEKRLGGFGTDRPIAKHRPL